MDDSSGIKDDPQIKKWHLLAEDRSVSGPYSLIEIAKLIENKRLTEKNFVWTDTLDKWTPLSKTALKAIVTGELVLFDQTRPALAPIEQKKQKLMLSGILPPSFVLSSPQKTASLASVDSTFAKKTKTISKTTIFSALGAVVLLLGAAGVWLNKVSLGSLENSLSKKQISEVKKILSLKPNTTSPSFYIATADSLKEPTLVIAANLPDGTNSSVLVEAIEGTLVGSYRFKKTLDVTFENGLVTAGPLRQDDGSFLPIGDYLIRVNHKQNAFEQKISLGHTNDQAYKTNLTKFKSVAVLKADEELLELNDYVLTFEDQIDELINSRKAPSQAWLDLQKQLGESLDEILLNQESIFYLHDYLNLKTLSLKITQMYKTKSVARAEFSDQALQVRQIISNLKFRLIEYKREFRFDNSNQNRKQIGS